MNKYLKILEFDKILDWVATFAQLDATKLAIPNWPLSNDADVVEAMLEEVDEASVLCERVGRFPLYFHQAIDTILTRLHKGGLIVPDELLVIGNFLDTMKANNLYYEKLENANIEAPCFFRRLEALVYVKELNLRIKQIIDPYGEILDDASPTLKSLRRQARDIEKRIESRLQEFLQKEASKLTQATVSMRHDRYVIPVKNDYKNAIKGIIHDQSASKETVFMEPMVVYQLTNELKSTNLQEQDEIERLMMEISGTIDTHYDEFLASYQELITMDGIFSKAQYALTIEAHRPQIRRDGVLDLVECFHPLLNVTTIVKNNIRIGDGYRGIIITGPNTGGKTVFLKTVGLLALMVKVGMLLPCGPNSSIPIYQGVYADIGDDQSISQNLSTFSSHMSNITNILKRADNASLVLLDEVGSGTDPVEGAALAISIFDYLIEKQCHVIATSHYSELKLHAYRTQDIINASVEFDEVSLKPTYKLLLGVPGMSNALKIAGRLGLPREVLDAAEHYTFKKNDDINQILERLVQESHELEKKLKLASDEIHQYQVKSADLESQKRRLLATEQSIMEKANQRAQTLVDQALEEINDLLFDLKRKKNQTVKLHEIADLTHRVRELESQAIDDGLIHEDHDIALQDHVFLKRYHCYGTIAKILPNERFDVQVGNATMRVERPDVQYVEAVSRESDRPKTATVSVGVKGRVSSTLDLRGKRYEEATTLIDKFIDDAVFANLLSVSIIHGFGTGVIRKLVQDTLKQSPYISEYRYGGANEGGQGVTIATLKK
ncbi:MAG: endonuclease MutS2 [Bacilli bacterium]